jgi:hypothetical protein
LREILPAACKPNKPPWIATGKEGTYKLIKQLNRSCKPKQSVIKDKNGKMLQGKDVKKRWQEHCSGLYTNSGHSDTVITQLDQISPSPSENEIPEIH